MSKAPNYYQVLQVAPNCSPEVLKASWRALSVKYHPDKPGGNAAKMRALNEAYEVLRSPEKRALYDVGLRDQLRQERTNGQQQTEGPDWMNGQAASASPNHYAYPPAYDGMNGVAHTIGGAVLDYALGQLPPELQAAIAQAMRKRGL